MAVKADIINSCKNCGIYFRNHDEKFPRLCDICALEFILGRTEVEPKTIPIDPIPATDHSVCSHAKEVPAVCPCWPNCYCRIKGNCLPVVSIKKPKKRVKRVKRERRYIGKFDYIHVEDDGTGD